ncbi:MULTISPECIES: HNH endonuclease [unclassified Synechococcus]|nr:MULTISPECIES: HNH endonuclease signature motif containing protein [unclassified Synechococcus]
MPPPPHGDQRLDQLPGLTRARGRCECCGAHEHQRALEVDHIIPKNQGSSNAISNLQALCFRCNAGKRCQARRTVCSARWSSSPGGGLGSLSTSETQCLAVASEQTAIRS